MNMYEIINGEGTAAQKIAKSRMCGMICRAIRAAHDKDENAMEKYLDELENFSCAYTIGVYAMFGKCGTDMPATVADNLTVPFNELYKIKRYTRRIYEMELKRK